MAISISETDAATTIAMNRPRLNLVDPAAVEAITRAFGELDPDKPVILTGVGETFSAGVDVKAFAALDRGGRTDFARAITAMTARILAMRGPVVAALPGHAIGGGLVLALCCDYRIAADAPGARFGLTEARAGVPFPAGPAAIIRHEIPAPLLRRLTLTSAEASAADLFAAGLFDALCPAADLQARALAAAEQLASQPGFVAVKTQVRGALRDQLAALSAAGSEPAFEAMG
jgi:enoyl-CoA hydratase